MHLPTFAIGHSIKRATVGFPHPPPRAFRGNATLVRLRNIEPLVVDGLEIAYRFAHGVPEHSLTEWLQTFPDAGARLHAIDILLSDDALDATCTAPDQQQALRIAKEVVRTLLLLCRDREKSLSEIVDELMLNAANASP